jgi:hypothetical protein
MNTSHYVFFLIFTLIHTTAYTMHMYIQEFNGIKGIQQHCFLLLEQLDKKKELNRPIRQKGTNQRFKALSANPTLSFIIGAVCHEVETKLGTKKAWHVEDVVSSKKKITLKPHGPDMTEGLIKLLPNEHDQTECSFRQLKKEFKSVLKTVRTGWRHAIHDDYLDINRYPSCVDNSCDPAKELNTWSLFVKRQKFYNEKYILDNICYLLGLSANCFCDNNWKVSSKHDNKCLYLWIKTEHLMHIFTTLQLHVKF